MKKFVAAWAAMAALLAGTASATVITFTTTLAPETLTATGGGDAVMTFDTSTNILHVDIDWFGLSSPTTVAHIHCCLASPGTNPLLPALGGSPTVGVAVTPGTLPGFPTGVTSGHYEADIDLTLLGSFTTAFRNNFGGGTVDGARAAVLAGMADGRAYLNIHTTGNTGGEIRGFITIPEPATWVLAALALGGVGAIRRRRGAAPALTPVA